MQAKQIIERHMPKGLRLVSAVLLSAEGLKIVRYFFGGVVVSVGYSLTVVALIETATITSAAVASAISFVLWTPVSYLVHRHFTFRVQGPQDNELPKFITTFLGKFLTSIFVVAALTNYFHLSYVFGIVANWIAIPAISYLILKLWVFEAATAADDRANARSFNRAVEPQSVDGTSLPSKAFETELGSRPIRIGAITSSRSETA